VWPELFSTTEWSLMGIDSGKSLCIQKSILGLGLLLISLLALQLFRSSESAARKKAGSRAHEMLKKSTVAA